MDLRNAEEMEIFNYLSEHTGDQIQNILSVETLYNNLEIEEKNNFTLPNWTIAVYPNRMKRIAAIALATFTETNFMKRMHGGNCNNNIFNKM